MPTLLSILVAASFNTAAHQNHLTAAAAAVDKIA
jgi:hypothetical protein